MTGINMIELRPFTKTDWYGFAGAEPFPNKDEPLIAESQFGIMIVDASGVGIVIYTGNDVYSSDKAFNWNWGDSNIRSAKDAKIVATGVQMLFSSAESSDDLIGICEELGIFEQTAG